MPPEVSCTFSKVCACVWLQVGESEQEVGIHREEEEGLEGEERRKERGIGEP